MLSKLKIFLLILMIGLSSCYKNKMGDQNQRITRQQMAKLVEFLPLFSNPKFKAIIGSGGGEKTSSGAISMPYPIYAPEVLKFYALIGQDIWTDYQYIPLKASQMLNDDQFISRANIEQIKTMLTYCVRGERFSDGHWSRMLDKGRLQAILKRLQVLKETL